MTATHFKDKLSIRLCVSSSAISCVVLLHNTGILVNVDDIVSICIHTYYMLICIYVHTLYIITYTYYIVMYIIVLLTLCTQ